MNIRIDPDLDSYKGFHDHAWTRQLEKSFSNTRLYRPFFELAASWKGVSNARRLPWLMMQHLKVSLESFASYQAPIPIQTLRQLTDRIVKGCEKTGLYLLARDRQALASEVREIETDLTESLKNKPFKIDITKAWSEYIDSEEFSLSLWMSEVQAYAGVYFAYENFLIQCLKVAANLQTLRTRDLPEIMSKLLGDELLKRCWEDEPIELARLIRHAIVHNGRKITKPLEKFREKLLLEEDEIVIMAYQTTELYQFLKNRLTIFSNELIEVVS